MSLFDIVVGIADAVSQALDADQPQGFGEPGHDIHDNPNDRDIWQNRPMDGQGNTEGRNGWGWENNRRLHDD